MVYIEGPFSIVVLAMSRPIVDLDVRPDPSGGLPLLTSSHSVSPLPLQVSVPAVVKLFP